MFSSGYLRNINNKKANKKMKTLMNRLRERLDERRLKKAAPGWTEMQRKLGEMESVNPSESLKYTTAQEQEKQYEKFRGNLGNTTKSNKRLRKELNQIIIHTYLIPRKTYKVTIDKEENSLYVEAKREFEDYFVTEVTASIDGKLFKKEITEGNLLKFPNTKKISYNVILSQERKNLYFKNGYDLGFVEKRFGGGGFGGGPASTIIGKSEFDFYNRKGVLPALKIAESVLGRRLIKDEDYVLAPGDFNLVNKYLYTVEVRE